MKQLQLSFDSQINLENTATRTKFVKHLADLNREQLKNIEQILEINNNLDQHNISDF